MKKNLCKSFYKLLITFSVTTISTQAATKNIQYTVKNGDSLYKIAKRNNTSIANLRKVNKMKINSVLLLGSIINVPVKIYSAPKKQIPQQKNQKLTSSFSNLETFTENKESPEKNEFFANIFSNDSKIVSDRCKKIISVAKTKLGKKYVWGASGTKNTYDCSSFTKYVYRKFGISIPRTSINQSKHGTYIKRADLQKGDLIFFDTSKRKKGYVNHVGIYLGDNKFIHASSAKKKVVITSLGQKFYSQRYRGARRPS